MTVNFEIKGMLAKLLATEDIIIEHKKVDTACFNVETRCLTLPLWEKASDNIYTLLCAHEVGHARETPNIDWTEGNDIPPQYVNIVEDARVEKLMKRRYNGLSKTFYTGYKELHEQDFFCLGDDDLSTYNFADRVNLYFKIGNFVSLSFNSKEQELLDVIAKAETFDDVLEASKLLYEYTKEEQKELEKIANVSLSSSSGGSSSSDSAPIQMNTSSEEGEGESSQSQQTSGNTDDSPNAQGQNVKVEPSSIDEKPKEPEVRTMKSLEEKVKTLNSTFTTDEIKYVEIPKLNLNTVIASNEEIHKEIDNCFNYQLSNSSSDLFKDPDLEYKKFKVSAQKEVGYLVKEFECRKAADSYSRSSISRTGVLNTSRLHLYKFSEDLFKKVTVVPDGKNHGLIFILDWSGSMQNIMMDTCKQLFNLIWFCKKLSIPFDVYAFTGEWARTSYDYQTQKYSPVSIEKHYASQEGLLYVDEHFTLMNLLTSKVSTSKFEHQMKNIWRVISYWKGHYNYTIKYSIPYRLSLSGTPLNESLVALHEIIPQFKKKNKIQKVHTIILTDGEAPTLNFYVKLKYNDSDEFRYGINSIRTPNFYLRDRELGTTYKFFPRDACYPYNFTDTLLKNLRDKFPTVSFIGIRVLEGGYYRHFVDMFHQRSDKQFDKIEDDWKKHKSFIITKSGYHAYFGMSSNALSQDNEFEVVENATKTQIKSAFTKSLKTKKMNKKILSEFVSLIA